MFSSILKMRMVPILTVVLAYLIVIPPARGAAGENDKTGEEVTDGEDEKVGDYYLTENPSGILIATMIPPGAPTPPGYMIGKVYPSVVDLGARDFFTMIGISPYHKEREGLGRREIVDHIDGLMEDVFKRKKKRIAANRDLYDLLVKLRTRFDDRHVALVLICFSEAMESEGILGNASAQIAEVEAYAKQHEYGDVDDVKHRDAFAEQLLEGNLGGPEAGPLRERVAKTFLQIMTKRIEEAREPVREPPPPPFRSKAWSWFKLLGFFGGIGVGCAVIAIVANHVERRGRVIIDEKVMKKAEATFERLNKMSVPQVQPGERLEEESYRLGR
jgi:hypothetical protein